MEQDNLVTQFQDSVTVYENEEKRLKHLVFVETWVENMIVYLTKLYELTKQHSGPLKARIEDIEEFLKTIFGPIFDKFHHFPFQLLQFLDLKVDELIQEIDWQHEPLPVVLTYLANKAKDITYELAMEIQSTGLVEATANTTKEAYLKYKPVAKELAIKYEPVAKEYAIWAWHLCKQVPVISDLTQVMVPTAAFWAERYNQIVAVTTESGLPMAQYLPLIPIERIGSVFAEEVDNGSGDVLALSY